MQHTHVIGCCCLATIDYRNKRFPINILFIQECFKLRHSFIFAFHKFRNFGSHKQFMFAIGNLNFGNESAFQRVFLRNGIGTGQCNLHQFHQARLSVANFTHYPH